MDDRDEMLEHYRITKLINEYCHGCDRLDGERMAAVYARDSWDDHGLHKMPGQDYARLAMATRKARTDSMSHHIGQTLVKIDGDEAGAETYFIATIVHPAGELNHLGGRYVDELVREGGKWKIRKRVTVRDWSVTLPIERDILAGKGFEAGQTNGSDPSFAVLGLRHSDDPVPE